jgi:hypothetical protein
VLEKGKQREADEKVAKDEPKTRKEKNSAPNYVERHS